mmetsp:Transcript_25587/g.35323  ORF Transcript_25587/g.35323 Transcript_25587/m.35323 type:complete len:337 (-) Transcript_25587:294-1304(-)
MEQFGNLSNYNLEGVLYQNITQSEYVKTLLQMSTWHEIVDEIYNEVTHCEPWMSGNARGPSSAFCIMFRFCQMKITRTNVQDLLDHGDSPFIRAIGFLYLRYVGDPKELWEWVEEYVEDEEEFQPSPGGRMHTIGAFVRDLLLEQYYFDTIMPRIPEVARRNILRELENRGLPTKSSGATGASGRSAEATGASRRPPSVKAALSVNLGQRAPHRADVREVGRGIDPTLNGTSTRGPTRTSRDPSPARSRDRDRNSSPRGSRGGEKDKRRRSRSPYRMDKDRRSPGRRDSRKEDFRRDDRDSRDRRERRDRSPRRSRSPRRDRRSPPRYDSYRGDRR